MREKIERKLEVIRKSIEERGMSDGTEIATKDEVFWLVCQAAKDGIMLHFSKEPNVYQKDNECYYYYTAMSINAGKERVREFVDTYPLMTVGLLNSLLNETDDSQVIENIKQIRRLIQARDRRRRARRRKEKQEMAELEERICIELEREEAFNNRNNLCWLISRIESMGYEVLLRHKTKDNNNIKE